MKAMIKLILLVFYCVPYTFLALYGDVTWGTMLYYGLMLVCFALLTWCAIQTKNGLLVLPGNLCSFVVSYVCALKYQTEPWSWYFKPFTGTQLLMILSLTLFLFQGWAVYRSSKGKTR